MWTFEAPSYLLLLLGLPVLIVLRHAWKGRGGRLFFPLGLWKGPRFSPRLPILSVVDVLSNAFLWLAVAAVIFALAGPTLTKQQKIFLNDGSDIMIVLDESPSMGARDFPPQSRFEAAKSVIEHFVKGRQNDAIGLVTFGSDAVLSVPLTMDYDYFLHQNLEKRKLMELGDGTALGMGIALAALHLESSPSHNKVIIVLTDGDNNAGEIQPGTAADLVRSLGIRLYLIGIGTSGEVPLEVTDPNSGLTYSGTLEGGFHEDYLKSLAVPPLGAYFAATSPGSLESIFQSIDSRETLSNNVKVQVQNDPLYPIFVSLSLELLALFFLMRKLALKEIL